jgi:phage baseplate assembly protein W
MSGMNARTGHHLSGADHIGQSIADLITTPIGSRVMRRDYGSLLPELIDQPFNAATQVKLYGATATAVMRWEPRIRLSHIALTPGSEAGAFTLALEGRRTDVAAASDYTRLTIPLQFRGG